MKANKLVVKCGNFAVLVDLHVLPQGSSKDTSWFSDHEKEEVCMLLKETIDSRVKQHIESRKQQGQMKCKEYTQTSPLFLKGDQIRIAAYFIKRWVNLRCVVKKQYRELHVFPDRFVVCASQLEPTPSMLHTEITTLEPCFGKSGYFAEHQEKESLNMLNVTPKKQAVLKNIVKKTKTTKGSSSKAEFSGDRRVSPCLGQADSDKANKGNKLQALTTVQSEQNCRTGELAKYCKYTTENSLELPVPEVENYVNHSQPCETSSQQKPQRREWLKGQDLSHDLSWICESAAPQQKQHHRTSVTQQKRRRHSSEGQRVCKRADLRDDTFIHQNERADENADNLPSNSVAHSFQNVSTDKCGTSFIQTVESAVEVDTILAPCINNKNLDMVSSLTEPEENRKLENQAKKLKLQRLKKIP
ncbi:protein SLX4IP [Bombina bombina]|uniref:protein SLX4IP n=1 Tax=Bombina bombina TaxID=8345 RepID=UPI00235B19DB|nr:protein SLX4IP [Bombina bombina]